MLKRLSCLAILLLCPLVLLGAALLSPYAFLALGDNAYASTDYAGAESLYDRAYSLAFLPDPQAPALWGRAQSRLHLGNFEAAVADYTALLTVQPEKSEAYARRADAHLALKHYEDAVEDLDAYLANEPDHPEQFALRGYAHLMLKDYGPAVNDLSVFLAANPEQPDRLAQRGYAYLQMDALDEAIADLQAAVNLKTSDMPKDRADLAEAYYRRAKRAAVREDYKTVIADLGLALIADATRPEMHTLCAFAAVQLSKYEDAVTHAGEALSLNGAAYDALSYRAVALAGMTQWKRAADDATMALQANRLDKRERSLALFARALSLSAQEQHPAAVRDATDALGLGVLDPGRKVMLYLARGWSQSELEAYKDASADYEAALALKPPERLQLVARNGAGWAHLALEEYKGAIDDFSVALGLAPDDPWLWAHRGLARSADKDYKGALSDYDRALSLNPRSAVVYSNRGIVQSALKEYEKSIADFEKSIDLSDDEDHRNRVRSYILLARAAIHGKEANRAADELVALTSKGTGKNVDQVKAFQQTFVARRQNLQKIQEQVGLMAEQYAAIEKLDLPDWYRAYAAKSRASLDREREGFALIEKAWVKTNTLVTILPRVIEQLEKAASSKAVGQEAMDRYDQFLGKRDYAGARALTASMRAELQEYRDYFERARRESGLGFIADAVQFYERQIDYVNQMDELTAALEQQDRARFDRALAQLDATNADINRIGKRMGAWDVELNRWFSANISPLFDSARAKFAEAETLGKEAAKIFDEAPKKLIIKSKRPNFPPPMKS